VGGKRKKNSKLIIMSTISERILEQLLQELMSQSPSPSLDNLPPFFQTTNIRNNDNRNNHRNQNPNPNVPRNREEVEHGQPIRFPEYDESMYRYHRNITDYQHVMLQMMECIESNRRLPVRQQNALLDNMIYPFNRNMQEYNTIMRQSLDILGEMHRHPTATHVPHIPPPLHNNNIHRNTAPTNTTMSEFYTLFPFVRLPERPLPSPFPTTIPSQPTTTTTTTNVIRRLTPAQIQLATRNYIYMTPNTTTTTPPPLPPVCAICLEEFRIGDSITQIRQCRHEFRTEYLSRWFQRDSRCPVCRCNLWDVPSVPSVPSVPLATTTTTTTIDSSMLSIPPSFPLVELTIMDASSAIIPPFRTRSMSEPHVFRSGNNSITMTPPPTMSDTSNHEIQQWLNTILSTRYPGFSNMDVDITYTVEYDVSMNPVQGMSGV
jgi:hypothetical protein